MEESCVDLLFNKITIGSLNISSFKRNCKNQQFLNIKSKYVSLEGNLYGSELKINQGFQDSLINCLFT